ncbi:UbiD family decarboxylase [bacterium]|nr:UbiD family decarboxylase [bacterium]
MDQSLRIILDRFEKNGDLHHVDVPVDPVYELGAVLLHKGHEPGLVFRNVLNHTIPVVGNLFNTYSRIALGLGVDIDHLQSACINAIENGIPPEMVAEGPVQQVIHEAPLDIPALLPVPTWFEQEQGPYITAGVIIAKDIETGKRNVSIARLRVEGGNILLAGIAPTHHLHVLMQKAQAQNRHQEIAVVIGNHTAVLIASQMYVDLGHDEYDIAGRLLGEPLRLVKCKNIDLEVPAEAEIVLEGTLHADERVEEGPVSEFHGFYEHYGPGNRVHIQTITHRRDPIYQAILPGYAPEHLLLGGTSIGATTCLALQKKIPSVKHVLITEGGMGRVHAIISMHQPKAGEGKRAIMLAMAHTNLLKLVIVVDDDIDPNDWTQVEWAMAARMRAEEDIMIIPGVKADRCDPQEKDLMVTKVGIVATRRPDHATEPGKFVPARAPEHVLRKVRENLSQY